MMENHNAEFVTKCPEMVEHVFAPVHVMAAEMQDFVARASLLADDVKKCQRPLHNNSGNQYWRRTFVRSVFVLIEAVVYGLKQAALTRHRHYEIEFSMAELSLLAEQKHTLDHAGEPRTDDTFYQKLVSNFRFAFTRFAKSFGSPFHVDMAKSPLLECERIRNRITHPKELAALTITDSEFKRMMDLWNWFSAEFRRLMELTAYDTVPTRVPDVRLSSPLPLTKPHVVVLTDGSVYQFGKRKDAAAFRRYHLNDAEVPPAIFTMPH